ncbi:AI-2E family transporter [Amnibacterium endophyticum]|uniref:AI-2E family transporter n=1 Tax=Amnibacterium endophyticum TaxID=2109337 RepID=A0ABW4LAS0_9MICO
MFLVRRGSAASTEAAPAPEPPVPVPVPVGGEDELRRVVGRILATWGDRFGRFTMRCLQVALLVAIAAAGLWLVGRLRLVVVPVVLAVLLTAAFQPMVRLLRRLRFPRVLAALTALLLGGGAIAAVVVLVVIRVESDWPSLVAATNSGVGQIQQALQNGAFPIDESQISEYRQDVANYLTSPRFGGSALAGLMTLAQLVTGTLVLLITLFFFLKDGDRIAAFLVKPLSGDRTDRAYRVGNAALHSLGGYVRGTALIALVDAVLIGGSLFVLGVPLALTLGVVVFIGAFVPVVGATIAGVLAGVVALVTNGLGTAITIGVIILVVNQLEAHVLQPLIMGRSVRLYPLVILLALIVGSITAGIVGAIVAVPVTSVIWDAMKLWDLPAGGERAGPVAAG